MLSCVEHFALWTIVGAQNRNGASAKTAGAGKSNLRLWDCSTLPRARNGGIRSHLIRQSGKRASSLNQDEFRLERWRNRVHLGREVLFHLLEVRIEDPDDRSRKLLEFV